MYILRHFIFVSFLNGFFSILFIILVCFKRNFLSFSFKSPFLRDCRKWYPHLFKYLVNVRLWAMVWSIPAALTNAITVKVQLPFLILFKVQYLRLVLFSVVCNIFWHVSYTFDDINIFDELMILTSHFKGQSFFSQE